MGLLSMLLGGGGGRSRTKADWDAVIQDLNRELANAQGRLASHKAMYGNSQPYIIAGDKNQIAQIKARIANAKIERKNALK